MEQTRVRTRAATAPLHALGDLLRGIPRPPGWVGVTLVVAFMTWPINVYPPHVSNNIDVSWITAMHVAAHEGLSFGSDFNFVYGPLGYLMIGNLFYDDTGVLATIGTSAAYLGAIALVARALCSAFGLFLGGLVTFVAARIALAPMDRVELLPGVLVALAVVALHRNRGALPPWQSAAIGLLAALCELVKFSAGSLALVVVAVLALVPLLERERPWRDRLRLAWPPLAGAGGGLILLWMLAGETLWDLVPYLRNSIDFVLGNVDAVATSTPGLGDEYVYASVAIVALLVAVLLDGRGLKLAPRLGIAALWLVMIYVSFRHGFTRHTPGHASIFFWPVLLAALATFPLTSSRAVAALACVPLLVGIWSLGDLKLGNVIATPSDPAVQHLDIWTSSEDRHAAQSDIREKLRQSYGFTPELIDRLDGETVHFDPHEAAIAWAYPEFDWHPAPVLQAYSTYTTHLDDLNAEFLAGDEAPRYVLRENVALDARNVRFESPRYVLELICRYREVLTTSRWQLLERGANRCGAPEPAGAGRLRFGQPVETPPSNGGLMVASFEDFDMPLEDRVRRTLLKRRTQWIRLGPGLMNRFVPGHAANPHVMVIPPCFDWSRKLFDPRAYPEVSIGWLPGVDTGTLQEPSFTVRFERVPYDCER